jgi:hypothetical protein
MKKDELIKELNLDLEGYKEGRWDTSSMEKAIADFILARETAMLEEIEKPLKGAQKGHPSGDKTAIDEALSIIQRRKGGK